jgi:glycosyltransferase involved in cell wall biosynthesis
VDQILVGEFLADRTRADLAVAGVGSGAHAFEWFFPDLLAHNLPHEIRVCNADTGLDIPGSPSLLPETTLDFDTRKVTLERAITNALGSVSSVAQFQQLRELLQREVARTQHPNPSVEDARATILVLDTHIPRIDIDADSNALISHMRSFIRLGFRVIFIPHHEGENAADAARDLRFLGIDCATDIDVTTVIMWNKATVHAIYVHRISTVMEYYCRIRLWSKTIPIIYSVADLHFLRFERQFVLDNASAPNGSARHEGIRSAELETIDWVDATVTHSVYEKELLKTLLPSASVTVVPWDIPITTLDREFLARTGVVFIGNFDHASNLDAADFLVTEIMPIVWSVEPTIECVLVGRDIPERFRSDTHGNVKVIGFVPDLTSIWQRVRLSVAPMRFGAGIKGKVLTSFASGVPCICSHTATEGLVWPSELDGLVMDDAVSIARGILWLHTDELENRRLGDRAQEWVGATFTEERIDSGFTQMFARVPRLTSLLSLAQLNQNSAEHADQSSLTKTTNSHGESPIARDALQGSEATVVSKQSRRRRSVFDSAIAGVVLDWSHAGVSGWAVDRDNVDAQVKITVRVDGVQDIVTIANMPSPTQQKPNSAQKNWWFAISFDPPLDSRKSFRIYVNGGPDKYNLQGSPIFLDAKS